MSADARRYLIAVILLAVLGSAAEAVRIARVPPAAYHPTFAEVPREIGTYTGRDLPVDQSIFAFLGAEAMLERSYEGPGVPVQMTVLYAPDWRSIHSPEGCFPAQGWSVLEEKVLTVASSAGPLQAKLIRSRKDDQHLLALFSFAYYGGTTADWTQEGYKVALGPRGAGGVLFSLSTPLESSDPAPGTARLTEVLQVAYPAAIAFWGKK